MFLAEQGTTYFERSDRQYAKFTTSSSMYSLGFRSSGSGFTLRSGKTVSISISTSHAKHVFRLRI